MLLLPTKWSSQNPKTSGKVPILLQMTLYSSTKKKLVLISGLIMVSSSDRKMDVGQKLQPMQQDPGWLLRKQRLPSQPLQTKGTRQWNPVGRNVNGFPLGGVGKQWMQCFITKYSKRLQTSWASLLESERGPAVNEHTIKAWFDLIHAVRLKYKTKPCNIYGSDEVGTNAANGESERVIGQKKKTPQYQQHDGNCENITIFVTICVDGTCLPPIIIFKGATHQVAWCQDNPTKAMWVFYILFSNRFTYSTKQNWILKERMDYWSNWCWEYQRLQQIHFCQTRLQERWLVWAPCRWPQLTLHLCIPRANMKNFLCYPAHTTHLSMWWSLQFWKNPQWREGSLWGEGSLWREGSLWVRNWGED